MVGTTKMNTRSLIVGQNFPMFPQEAESKYKNIVTGYEVDDTSEGESLFRDVVLDNENSQI